MNTTLMQLAQQSINQVHALKTKAEKQLNNETILTGENDIPDNVLKTIDWKLELLNYFVTITDEYAKDHPDFNIAEEKNNIITTAFLLGQTSTEF